MTLSHHTTVSAPPSPTMLTRCSFSIPGIQVDEALARFAGDEERYRYWLIEFISHGPAAASQIRQAVNKGSQDAATALTHALKGRTGMLGMAELHRVVLTLETGLIDREPIVFWLDELDHMVNEISRNIAGVLKKMEH